MTTKFAVGVEAIQKLAVNLRGMLEVADALTAVGSVEQAAYEADQRTRAAQRAEGVAVEAMQEAQQRLADTTESARKLAESAALQHDTVVADAHEQAKVIVASAEEQAEKMTTGAKTILAESRAQLAELANATAARQAQATARLEDLQRQIAEAEAALDALNKQLAAARAAVASIIKG